MNLFGTNTENEKNELPLDAAEAAIPDKAAEASEQEQGKAFPLDSFVQ